MITIKNLFLTIFLGGIIFSHNVSKAEDSSSMVEHISSKPAKNFRGGYLGINLGVSGDNNTLSITVPSFDFDSGSSGYTLYPSGFIEEKTVPVLGKYGVSHQMNAVNHERIYAGEYVVALDARGGWSFMASNHGTLGGEIGIIWQGGRGSEFSFALPANVNATFANDGKAGILEPSEINAAQNHLVGQTDNEGRSTSVEIDNAVNINFFVKNSVLVNFLFTCGYAISPEVFMGIKTGIALGSKIVKAVIDGEYGSAGYFIDNFLGVSPATASNVTWDSKPDSHNLDAISTNNFACVFYVFAPAVEIKMTSSLSLTMEAKFFLQGSETPNEFSFNDMANGSVDTSVIFESSNTMMATLGFQYRPGLER